METYLQLEDCIHGMPKLDAKSVDVIVTSPPYNIGKEYTKYNDDSSRKEYLKWTTQWTRRARRLLKEDGSFFLNVGATPANPLLPHQLAIQISKTFDLQNTFHWIKSISVNKVDAPPISVGHFKPINSKRYVTDCHEYVFHFTKTGNVQLDRTSIGVPYTHKSNVNRWKHTDGKDLRCRGNNWFIPYKTINFRHRDRPHPATYPTQLAENCIRMHGLHDDLTVMDPFLGIGHSLVAAINCKVSSFIGFEIDEVYLEESRKWVQLTLA